MCVSLEAAAALAAEVDALEEEESESTIAASAHSPTDYDLPYDECWSMYRVYVRCENCLSDAHQSQAFLIVYIDRSLIHATTL